MYVLMERLDPMGFRKDGLYIRNASGGVTETTFQQGGAHLRSDLPLSFCCRCSDLFIVTTEVFETPYFGGPKDGQSSTVAVGICSQCHNGRWYFIRDYPSK